MSIPEEYVAAGRIAARVRSEVDGRVHVGMRLLEICEMVEGMIRREGGEPAFPCNVSVNSVAAHYTSTPDDPSLVKDGDVVKVDFGVHINGYLVDTATTVSFNPELEGLVHAVKEALAEALKATRGGVRVGEIGGAIAGAAKRRGFRPITNLCGHLIGPYQIHAGLSIPNMWVPGTRQLKAGSVCAIEPFLTLPDSRGVVVEGGMKNIFSLVARKATGSRPLDRFAEEIWRRHRTLPFTPRYFSDAYGGEELKQMVEKLVKMKILRAYPVLLEPKGRCVTQAEHTIAVTESGATVLTA